MKEFSHHEPCPKCGSKDNLGVWQDGQKWCFGCKYFIQGENAKSLKSMQDRFNPPQQEEKSDHDSSRPALPADYSRQLPDIATQWLVKYGISKGERIKNHIGWSDKYESLIFPVFDVDNSLLLVQRRYFGTDLFPKYHTRGKPESLIHVLGGSWPSTCVLVEDLISAIKVGRQFYASPLWGSNLSIEKIKRLSSQYAKLILWLDRDKAKDSIKFKWKALPFFDKVSIIVTNHDPKEYNDDAIFAAVTPNL